MPRHKDRDQGPSRRGGSGPRQRSESRRDGDKRERPAAREGRDGERKPRFSSRQGDDDRKPKRFSAERRDGDGKPRRFDRDGDRKPRPFERAGRDDDRKPKRFARAEGDGERRPPRFDRAEGDRERKPGRFERDARAEGGSRFRDRRSEEGAGRPERRSAGERPYAKKTFEKKSFEKRPFEKKPFEKRESFEGSGGGGRRFAGSDDRPRPRRSYAEGEERGERKPFRARPGREDERGAGSRGPRRSFPGEGRERFERDDRPRFARRDRDGERQDDARPARGPREERFARPPRRDRAEAGDAGQRGFRRPREERGQWQDHPRSERPGRDEARRSSGERAGVDARNERAPREARPAFGGRGPYRERRDDDRKGRGDKRGAPDRAPAPQKTGERIAKRLARAGLCSRRDAEEWIMQGRVAVNGRILTSPALDVTDRDRITVDGEPLPERERTRLFLYHKPKGLMTTHSDPEGRPTVFDQLPPELPRLISVGRLDFNTEGLLLLTNDGGLARTLELPDTGWLRRYRVRAHGNVTQPQLDALRAGVEIDGVRYGPIEAELERDQGSNVWLTVGIREGKNREVRNVLAHLGLEVNRLIRISYGPFQLAEIPEGEVEEVRTRVLRDQLGEKIASLAHVDFEGPKRMGEAEPSARGDRDPAEEKPRRSRAGLVSDRKGRRVLVERSGESGERAGPRPGRPRRTYHGKRERHKDTD